MKKSVKEKGDANNLSFGLEISRYKPISFIEYLQIVKNYPETTETSAERLYRIVSEGSLKRGEITEYPFFRKGKYSIKGLSDVINQTVLGIYAASQFYKRGQILLLSFIGPTGSGKSEIGKLLEEGLVNDLEKNSRYTFYFINKGKEISCPFNEDPINLISTSHSLIPSEIREYFSSLGGKDLCPSCSKIYNSLLIKKFGEFEERAKSKVKTMLPRDVIDEEHHYILYALNEIVKVVRLKPQIASISLTHKEFGNIFENAIKKANRGILHIEIDDTEIEDIPDTNYQLLLKLRDSKVQLIDGSIATPDLVVLLYANSDIIEKLGDTSPLVDALYPIFVRRNLSYSAESEIFLKSKLPFSHISPGSLEVLSKFVVGTRIDTRGLGRDEFEKYLEIYEKYDTGLPLNDEERKIVRERLPFGKPTKDGWNIGKSSRKLIKELFNTIDNPNACLTLERIINYLDSSYLGTNLESEYDYTEGYELALDVALEAADNIAFGRLMIGYMANVYEIEGGVNRIENLFSYYKKLLEMKNVEFKTEVDVIGIGKVPIESELENVARKLNVYKNGTSEFDKAIETYKIQHWRFPTFLELVTEKPYVINVSEEMKKFLPWEIISRGEDLNKEDKERYDKLRNILKEHLGHCDECADSIIYIASIRMEDEK
jgi:hypothetical protein